MIRPTQNIRNINQEIKNFFHKEVDVRVNLGRNKIVNFTGLLSGIYPALFTVLPNDANYRGKTSYAYSEVLCGNVKIRETAKKA